MSKRRELRDAIIDTEQEIEALEQKLFRSQTVLMLNLIDGTKPDKTEVDFFKLYASLIEQARKRLLQYNREYNSEDGEKPAVKDKDKKKSKK